MCAGICNYAPMNMRTTWQDIALLLFRVVLGGSMIVGHGLRKLEQVTGGEEIRFGDPLGLGPELSLYMALFAEVVCAGLIVLGLFTRLATIPLIITMAVVVIFVQMGKPFSNMELPLIYLAGFIVIAIFGGGRFALDYYRHVRY